MRSMRYGFVGTFGTACEQVELAEVVEANGWDGFFTWDALSIADTEAWDPWALLAAAAVRTTRVRLGAMVFAPARHDPAVLARQVQTVDHLSGGRLVLPVGVGAGDDAAYSRLGRDVTVRERAERLDDALALLDATSAGRDVSHQGTHGTWQDLVLAPGTVQRPRVPVWVVGAWPSRRSLARAARWDGLVVQRLSSQERIDGQAVLGALELIGEQREADGLLGPYDVVVSEEMPADDAAAAERAAELESWGVTWWVHADWSTTVGAAATNRQRAAAGPPQA